MNDDDYMCKTMQTSGIKLINNLLQYIWALGLAKGDCHAMRSESTQVADMIMLPDSLTSLTRESFFDLKVYPKNEKNELVF